MCKVLVFCNLLETLDISVVNLLVDTGAKTGIDAAKTASKRVVQKTVEATGNQIGNKIADKITSVGKSKNKDKEEKGETNEIEEIYIPPEKRQQIIDNLRLFQI